MGTPLIVFLNLNSSFLDSVEKNKTPFFFKLESQDTKVQD